MTQGSLVERILFLGALLIATPVLAASTQCSDSLKSFLKKIELPDQSPAGSQHVSAKLMPPKGRALRALAKDPEQKLYYIVDPENRVYFVAEKLELDSRKLMIVDHKDESGKLLYVPVKEGGRIEFNKTKKSFQFHPEYQPIDLADEEIALIRNSAEESGESISHSSEGVARAKMMDCQKVYEARRSGKSFVWDQFLTNNALLTLSIATHNPQRFTDKANFDMLITDYVTGNEHTAIRAFTGRYMMLNNVGYLKRLASRIAVGLGSTQVQGWTSQFILEDKGSQSSSERADQITQFNRMWMFPSLIKSDALDKIILQKLPEVAYDLCLKGSPLRIFASPKMVRFAEGWLSSTIYFTLRDQYTADSER